MSLQYKLTCAVFNGVAPGDIDLHFSIIQEMGGDLNKGKQQMAENKSELNGKHMMLDEVFSKCTASQPCSTPQVLYIPGSILVCSQSQGIKAMIEHKLKVG
jgi:hypothetical protein